MNEEGEGQPEHLKDESQDDDFHVEPLSSDPGKNPNPREIPRRILVKEALTFAAIALICEGVAIWDALNPPEEKFSSTKKAILQRIAVINQFVQATNVDTRGRTTLTLATAVDSAAETNSFHSYILTRILDVVPSQLQIPAFLKKGIAERASSIMEILRGSVPIEQQETWDMGSNSPYVWFMIVAAVSTDLSQEESSQQDQYDMYALNIVPDILRNTKNRNTLERILHNILTSYTSAEFDTSMNEAIAQGITNVLNSGLTVGLTAVMPNQVASLKDNNPRLYLYGLRSAIGAAILQLFIF